MQKKPTDKSLMYKAQSLYHDGMRISDIAHELGISSNTIYSWKHRYEWDEPELEPGKIHKARTNPKAIKEFNEDMATLEKRGLTENQSLFCINFVKSLNATTAYQKAFNSSYAVANKNGYTLLEKPKIKAEIERLKAERFKKAHLTQEDIINKYIAIAFSDITDYVTFNNVEEPVIGMFGPVTQTDEDGRKVTLTRDVNKVTVRPSRELDGSLITEIKQGKEGFSIKLIDKMKALEFLAQHMGLATPKQKLEMDLMDKELTKLDLLIAGLDKEASEHEDDGFIEALGYKVNDTWKDEIEETEGPTDDED